MTHKALLCAAILSAALVVMSTLGLVFPALAYKQGSAGGDQGGDTITFGIDDLKDLADAVGNLTDDPAGKNSGWVVKDAKGNNIRVNSHGASTMYFVGFVFLALGLFQAMLAAIFKKSGYLVAHSAASHIATSMCFLYTACWIAEELDLKVEFSSAAGKSWGLKGVMMWVVGFAALLVVVLSIGRAIGFVMQRHCRTSYITTVSNGFISYAIAVLLTLIIFSLVAESSTHTGMADKSSELASPLWAINAIKAGPANFQSQVGPICALFALWAALGSGVCHAHCREDARRSCGAWVAAFFSLVAAVLHGVWLSFVFAGLDEALAPVRYHWGWSVVLVGLNAILCSLSFIGYVAATFTGMDSSSYLRYSTWGDEESELSIFS